MAQWTYCVVVALSKYAGNSFSPDIVYNTVSNAWAAWAVHAVLLRLVLWAAGVPSPPLVEVAAYAGYVFVAASAALAAHLAGGGLGYHVVWAYGSLCMAVFLVRSMKRAIYQETNQYSEFTTAYHWEF
jgi:protein transport protein YIF1